MSVVFVLFQMNEGRKSQIVLLDDRRLDIIIQVSDAPFPHADNQLTFLSCHTLYQPMLSK